MQCYDITENLSAFIDGMLDSSVASQVEKHLASCDRCRAEYDELLAAVELVRGLPEVAPPPGFREDLRQRLLAGVSTGDGDSIPKPTTRRFFGGRWVGMVAAAAVFFLTVGVTALWYDKQGGIPFPELGGKVASESGESPSRVSARAERASNLNGSAKKGQGQSAGREAPGKTDYFHMESEPAPEAQPENGGRGGSTGPATGGGNESYSIAQTEEAGSMMDAAAPTTQSKKSEESHHFITALTDEEKAARDAPPGFGAGPYQAVEYTVVMQVNDGKEAVQKISGAAAKYGGFLESQHGEPVKRLVLKVPFYAVEPFIEEIGQVGTVTDQQSEHRDLLPEIQQLESSLSELQAREKELVQQLANQPDNTAEGELTRVREQIAALQAELAAVSTGAMMACINLNISIK